MIESWVGASSLLLPRAITDSDAGSSGSGEVVAEVSGDAEPYPFFWLDGGPTTIYRYRASPRWS